MSEPITAPPAPRDGVVQVGLAVRHMGAQSVITRRTVADRFGLNMTDLEVLYLIFLRHEASAGELAQATGLSSGSVTALVERLERAGYVERGADVQDRRRVIVRMRAGAPDPIRAIYLNMQRQMFDLWSGYSDRDLAVITDFMTRSTALAVDCCKTLATDSATSAVAKRRPGKKL